MALVPTLLAIAIGLGLGLRWGGRIDNLLGWRPVLPMALGVGVTALILADIAPIKGAFGTLVALVGMGALLAFGVLNIRTGGMVLFVAGVGLDLFVTLVNGGTPVSTSALVSAGVVDAADVDSVVLSGGRKPADGTLFGFLGDTIPLPWGQVVSIGGILTLLGVVLVTASVVRRYEVGGGNTRTTGPRAAGRGPGGGPNDYRTALDALGRGPAPRRGPGLHPSRLEERRRPARRRPGTGPR